MTIPTVQEYQIKLDKIGCFWRNSRSRKLGLTRPMNMALQELVVNNRRIRFDEVARSLD